MCAGVVVVVGVRVNGMVLRQSVRMRLPVHGGASGQHILLTIRVVCALEKGENKGRRDNVQQKYADHDWDAAVVDNRKQRPAVV